MADLKAKVEIRAEDRFSGPAEAAGRGASKLARSVSEGRKALDALGRERDALASVDSLGKKVSATAAKMDIAAKRTADLRRRMRETRQPTAALRKEFEQAQRQSQGLHRAHREQSAQLRRMKADLLGAASGSRDLARAQRQVEERMDAARASMQRVAEAVGRADTARAARDRSLERASRVALAAESAGRLGESVLRFGARTVSRARDVSRAEGGLQSLKLSPADARIVSRRGLEVQRRVAYVRADDFTDAAYQIQSGIEDLDATGVADLAEAAAVLGRATRATTAQMADAIKTGWAMFRREGEEAREFGGRFAAQMAHAVGVFPTTGPKMEAAIAATSAGPTRLGIEDAELFAALGMLQQSVKSPEMVGTMMEALARVLPAAQKEYGSRLQLAENGRAVPLADMLAGMSRLYGGTLEIREKAEIDKAFGEQASRFFNLLHGQEDALRGHAEAQRAAAAQSLEYARAMQRAYDATADARLELVQQRWDAVMIQLGEATLPALEQLADKAGGAADWVGKAAEKFPNLTSWIVGGTIVLGGLTVVAAKAAIALTWLGLAAKQAALWQAGRKARGVDGPVAGGRPGSRPGDAPPKTPKNMGRRLPRIPGGPGARAAMLAAAVAAPAVALSGRGEPEAEPEAGKPEPRNIDLVTAIIHGASYGALLGGTTTMGLGTLPAAVVGAIGGLLVSLSAGREETPPAVAGAANPPPQQPEPVRQHVGDINISVQPLPGEDPETYARRVVELARDADLGDLDGLLVDGVI